MTTKATPTRHETTREATLFVAFELSDKTWKLGFTTGAGQKPRERGVTARHQERVLNEIAQAKRRDHCRRVPAVSGGRSGFSRRSPTPR